MLGALRGSQSLWALVEAGGGARGRRELSGGGAGVEERLWMC